jgi:integrase
MPRANNSSDRNLYQRGDAIYFRITLVTSAGPVEVNQSLGRIGWETARKVRDALVQTLEGATLCQKMGLPFESNEIASQFGADAMLKRLGIVARRQMIATIGEIITAFDLDAAGRDMQTDSVYKACSSLRNLLKTTLGLKTREEADALSSSILTAKLLQDYQAAKIKTAKDARDGGPDALGRALTTAASTVNQARSVVSERALREKRMRELRLPDLAEFRAWKPDGSTRKLRKPVDDDTIARLRDAIDDMWFHHPKRWLALALCGNLGLRRGSAVMARWTWVLRIAGKHRIYLLKTDEAAPKGNEYSVEIVDSLWTDMNAVRDTGSDYIIPGKTREERDAVLQENVQWLRDLGLDVGKPNHELRAIFAQAMRREYGRDAASEALGHGDKNLVDVYTGRGASKGVRVF